MVTSTRTALLSVFVTSLLLVAGCTASPDPGLKRPNGVAVAADGTLYVTDSGNKRIVHLAPDGKVLNTLQLFTDTKDRIFSAWDLAFDREGNLVFSTLIRGNERIRHDGVQVRAVDGTLLRELGSQDYPEGDDVTSNTPYGVDVDQQGRIYVGCDGSRTVQVYAPDGTRLGTFFANPDTEMQFSGINDVAVDRQRQLLYVVDYITNHIEQFQITTDDAGALQLSHQLSISDYGEAPGQVAFPQNIIVEDATGLVYVGNMANRRIEVFDPQGNYVRDFTAPGVPDWQVMGLNFGGDGNLYAADAYNNAIWVFTPDGTFVRRIEVKP